MRQLKYKHDTPESLGSQERASDGLISIRERKGDWERAGGMTKAHGFPTFPQQAAFFLPFSRKSDSQQHSLVALAGQPLVADYREKRGKVEIERERERERGGREERGILFQESLKD